MVSTQTINRLSLRIEQLAEQSGRAERPTYKVFLDFGESDEEFYARYPEARGRLREGIIPLVRRWC